ncbi:MAG TPA: hypothetical protein VHX15_00630 [Frankiaceae bacterium]|nr:hypothetical protein [Frankiaceae bacterium]
MRPDVSEQLDGLRRILESVVAPELADPYPIDILAGVCATLETLSSGWQLVPGFLQWDAEMSAALLRQVITSDVELDGALHERVRAVVLEDPPDATNLPALQARHVRVRQALADVMPVVMERDELRGLRTYLAAHLRERAERYPLKAVWRPAGAPKD